MGIVCHPISPISGSHCYSAQMFMQLWHVGRAAREQALDKTGLEMVGSSDIPISDEYSTTRAMMTEEIRECIAFCASS